MMAAVVVGIVVAAGIVSVAYVEYNAHHLPIHSSNTVVNETVAENFLNYSVDASPPTPLYNFNTTTSFAYHDSRSNLTLKATKFAPFYGPLDNPPDVILYAAMVVTGNISTALHPTGVLVTLSDVGPFNNSNVHEIPYASQSYPPQSNVTSPNASTFPQLSGSFAVHGLFKLINEKATNGMFTFGLIMVLYFEFFVYHSTIGTHILHMMASLQGLGVPVTASINVLLIDKK